MINKLEIDFISRTSITNMKFISLIAFIATIAIVAADKNAETDAMMGPKKSYPIMDELLSKLSPEQKACLKDKWQKESEAMKAAGKECHDKKGGLQCIKAIPQIKACMD